MLVAKVAAAEAVGAVYVVSATTLPDVNAILSGLALLGVLYWGPKYAKTQDLKARLRAKDDIIATDGQTVTALKERVDTLAAELAGLERRAIALAERATLAEREAAEWKGRYDEQSKYTAQAAIERLERVLAAQEASVEARDATMLHAVTTLTKSHDKFSNVQSTLIGRIDELVHRLAETAEQQQQS